MTHEYHFVVWIQCAMQNNYKYLGKPSQELFWKPARTYFEYISP